MDRPALTTCDASSRYATDAERWEAIAQRDSAADGAFVYSVRTTGVYCRPVCPARRALRQNIHFHDSPQAAELAGFRPCRRCKPQAEPLQEQRAHLMATVCRMIEAAPAFPGVETLARACGISPFHLHRLFKAEVGISLLKYHSAVRGQRLRAGLAEGHTVLQTARQAGYESTGPLYASSTALLGMSPSTYRSGGKGMTIRFAVGQCWLGDILVAATERGLCAILLGEASELLRDLQDRFPQAELVGGDGEFESWMARVIGFVANPGAGLHLPLDVRGTAFQQQVWDALQQIPVGETVTYTELAARLGRPQSVRAVASACAANPVAVAIPCHRVIRTDGSLAGYRWGIERKQQLLDHEQQSAVQK